MKQYSFLGPLTAVAFPYLIFEAFQLGFFTDKLKGTNIPYFARIVAVVDVYDALTSERSYRKSWTHSEAMRYIIENKGTHFDPQCVDAWEQLCTRNPSVYQYPAQMIKDQPTIQKLSSLK